MLALSTTRLKMNFNADRELNFFKNDKNDQSSKNWQNWQKWQNDENWQKWQNIQNERTKTVVKWQKKWQDLTWMTKWWHSSKNRKSCQTRTTKYWILGQRSDMLAVKKEVNRRNPSWFIISRLFSFAFTPVAPPLWLVEQLKARPHIHVESCRRRAFLSLCLLRNATPSQFKTRFKDVDN